MKKLKLIKKQEECKHENSTWDNDAGCMVCDECNIRLKQRFEKV